MSTISKSPHKLTAMKNIRDIAQEAMKEKGLTLKDVKKSLGIKRYGQ